MQTPFSANLPDCFQAAQVSLQALRQSGLPLTETTYLALGGGLGSFAWVDYLRVCGAAANQIVVVGREATPYARFQRLCRHSQIFDDERIRSDSGARPDNLWGWPGYALQEIALLLGQNKWGEAGRIAWQIFSEPTLAQTYTPRAQMVFAALEREMKRIGWRQMARRGEIYALRQTDDGRYVVAYVPGGGSVNGRPPQLLIAPYLHLALGYPAINLAPETVAYRQATHDLRLVVQAYEYHEHIYEELGQRGGLLILRGRGIVASRILQRLDEVRRASGKHIRVIHLLRSPIMADTHYGRAHRRTHHHWQLQPFNWPKAALGGDLRLILERATPEERQALFATWGGSTTSDRHDWQEIVARGLREGWYSHYFGNIEAMKANGRNRLILHLQTRTPQRLVADFMIDCTGLNAELCAHPLLADMSQRYQLPKNSSGRLLVTPDFEVKEMCNGGGQLFMAGTMAFGNAFAPVDSFLGLQYAAQRSLDVLIRENAPGLQRLNGRQSLRQWWRWWQGLEP
jgi:pSer/pThr/pTyr-binding forkhead associated (FHA) protein